MRGHGVPSSSMWLVLRTACTHAQSYYSVRAIVISALSADLLASVDYVAEEYFK